MFICQSKDFSINVTFHIVIIIHRNFEFIQHSTKNLKFRFDTFNCRHTWNAQGPKRGNTVLVRVVTSPSVTGKRELAVHVLYGLRVDVTVMVCTANGQIVCVHVDQRSRYCRNDFYQAVSTIAVESMISIHLTLGHSKPSETTTTRLF